MFSFRFGSRITCLVGSLISSVAIFASSYSSSLSMLLLTYGVMGGVGLGLMYAPAVVTVGQYFTRRLNLATGICVCGSGAGTFLFAPIASGLISSYGWRGCNRVMAAFCLLCSLLGLIMAPNNRRRQVRDMEDKPRKLIDLTILRDVPFTLSKTEMAWSLSVNVNIIFSLAMMIPLWYRTCLFFSRSRNSNPTSE